MTTLWYYFVWYYFQLLSSLCSWQLYDITSYYMVLLCWHWEDFYDFTVCKVLICCFLMGCLIKQVSISWVVHINVKPQFLAFSAWSNYFLHFTATEIAWSYLRDELIDEKWRIHLPHIISFQPIIIHPSNLYNKKKKHINSSWHRKHDPIRLMGNWLIILMKIENVVQRFKRFNYPPYIQEQIKMHCIFFFWVIWKSWSENDVNICEIIQFFSG